MSAGSTAIELAKVIAPLAGVWLGFRIERWRRTDESDAMERQHQRDQLAAARDAESAALSAVMTTAAAWRREIVEVVAPSWAGEVEIDLGALTTAHASFGQAVAAARVLLDDATVQDALDSLNVQYENGFDGRQLVHVPEDRIAGANRLDDIGATLGDNLNTLQAAARRYFSANRDGD